VSKKTVKKRGTTQTAALSRGKEPATRAQKTPKKRKNFQRGWGSRPRPGHYRPSAGGVRGVESAPLVCGNR